MKKMKKLLTGMLCVIITGMLLLGTVYASEPVPEQENGRYTGDRSEKRKPGRWF